MKNWYLKNNYIKKSSITPITIEGKSNSNNIKIVIIQGSARSEESCPGQNGKTKEIVNQSIKQLPDYVDVELIDLSVSSKNPIVQPCKGCVSTSNGFHCHWPCSCYSKDDKEHPDFMHDHDVYKKLEEADGFAVFCPVNWYSVPTQVKAAFDRLVCANLTITVDNANKLYGKTDIKNPKKTRASEKSGKYSHLLKNHLEGKVAAFFIHGDNGGSDYINFAKNKYKEISHEPPDSLISHWEDERSSNSSQAIMPLVLQCRYSGIYVPDNLVVFCESGTGIPYSKHNDIYKQNDKLFQDAFKMINNLVKEIRERK